MCSSSPGPSPGSRTRQLGHHLDLLRHRFGEGNQRLRIGVVAVGRDCKVVGLAVEQGAPAHGVALDAGYPAQTRVRAFLPGQVHHLPRGGVELSPPDGGHAVGQVVGGDPPGLGKIRRFARKLVEVVAFEVEGRLHSLLGGAHGLDIVSPVEHDNSIASVGSNPRRRRRRRDGEVIVVGVLDQAVGEFELGDAAQVVAADAAQECHHHLLGIAQCHGEWTCVEHDAAVSGGQRDAVVPSLAAQRIPVQGEEGVLAAQRVGVGGGVAGIGLRLVAAQQVVPLQGAHVFPEGGIVDGAAGGEVDE